MVQSEDFTDEDGLHGERLTIRGNLRRTDGTQSTDNLIANKAFGRRLGIIPQYQKLSAKTVLVLKQEWERKKNLDCFW